MAYLKGLLLLVSLISTSISALESEGPHFKTLNATESPNLKLDDEPKFHSVILKCHIKNNKITLPVDFSIANIVQTLELAVSTTTEGVYLFSDDSPNCSSSKTENLDYNNTCYKASAADKSSWCLPQELPCSIENLCLNCAEGFLEQEPSQYSTFNFDGYPINDTRIQGNDSFSIKFITGIIENSQTFKDYPIQLIKKIGDFPSLPTVTTLDGIIGISGPQICFRGKSFWNDVMKRMVNPIFGIDSFIPFSETDSSLKPHASILMGDAHKEKGEILWSQRRQTGDSKIDALYRFTIYDLTLCNSNLLNGITSNWDVEIDTNSQCLILPPYLYENLLSWIPVTESNYYEDSGENEKRPVWTKLLVNEDYTSLPKLSFKLNEFATEYFYIPLSSLVYYDHEVNRNVLCVTKRYYHSNLKRPESNLSIGFGLSVLNLLYPVMDFRGYRVGLVQKHFPSKQVEGDETCLSRASCIGKQVYIPSSNSCQDPTCSEYFFMTLENETKECKIASYVFPIVFSFIIALSLSEFGLSIFYYHVVKVTEAHSK